MHRRLKQATRSLETRLTFKHNKSIMNESTKQLLAKLANRNEINKTEHSQKERHDNLQTQREHLRKGEKYIEGTLPLEVALAQLESEQEVGRIVKRSIKFLAQKIANDPKLTEIAIKLQDERRGSRSETGKNEGTKNGKVSTEKQAFISFVKKSPLAKFIKNEILADENESLYQEILVELTDQISRYALAITRSDKRNMERAGQATYRFEPYLDASAQKILELTKQELPAGINFSQVDTILNGLQIELESKLDKEQRTYSLLNWITKTARLIRTENLKIFDTPETQNLIARLEATARQKNGIGGAILYGPPGTGKTEVLVERNRRLGFESRVISIHHFTDFVQLIGEKPVPIGIDTTTSHVERLTLVRDNLQQMRPEQRLAYVQERRQQSSEAWQEFLELAALEPVDLNLSQEKIDQSLAEKIVSQLIAKISTDITHIGLGMKNGLDEETAWARGEIIQALEKGQMPILDEMDKGSSHSLEGISRLLNLSPGQKINLGEEEFTIPTWARIDGTANAMNLAPFLHDRFAPNVIYVDFSSSIDTLLKSVVWLSNEQGVINLSPDLQKQFMGIVLYVFPEIQKLYPDTIEHPLSNRGIRKFCQMIALGHSVYEALDELLLKSGALTEDPAGRQAVQRILDRFGLLTAPTVSAESGNKITHKSQMMSSPLLLAVKDYFHPYDHTKGSQEAVQLTAKALETLKAKAREVQTNNDGFIVTPVGTTINIEEQNGSAQLAVRLDGKLLTEVEMSGVNSRQQPVIASTDRVGNLVLIRDQERIYLTNITTTETAVTKKASGINNVITGDGKFVVSHNSDDTLSLRQTEVVLAKKEKAPQIKFLDTNGNELKSARFDLSTNGDFLLIESFADESFIVDLRVVNKKQGRIQLAQPFTDNKGWVFGPNNTLLHPDQDMVYVFK